MQSFLNLQPNCSLLNINYDTQSTYYVHTYCVYAVARVTAAKSVQVATMVLC